MTFYSHDLMYEVKLKQPKILLPQKKDVDEVVGSMRNVMDVPDEIQIMVDLESPNKKLFSVSVHIEVMGQKLMAKKKGKNILTALIKAKKAIIRSHKRVHNKCLNRKKQWLNESCYPITQNA